MRRPAMRCWTPPTPAGLRGSSSTPTTSVAVDSNCISHLLSRIPYKRVEKEPVELPKRSHKGKYDDEAALDERRWVPQKF